MRKLDLSQSKKTFKVEDKIVIVKNCNLKSNPYDKDVINLTNEKYEMLNQSSQWNEMFIISNEVKEGEETLSLLKVEKSVFTTLKTRNGKTKNKTCRVELPTNKIEMKKEYIVNVLSDQLKKEESITELTNRINQAV